MAINVLLVEDDELLVKRIQNHFTDTEFSIEIDPTGADALNIVRQRVNLRSAISLAIIDIVLLLFLLPLLILYYPSVMGCSLPKSSTL